MRRSLYGHGSIADRLEGLLNLLIRPFEFGSEYIGGFDEDGLRYSQKLGPGAHSDESDHRTSALFKCRLTTTATPSSSPRFTRGPRALLISWSLKGILLRGNEAHQWVNNRDMKHPTLLNPLNQGVPRLLFSLYR